MPGLVLAMIMRTKTILVPGSGDKPESLLPGQALDKAQLRRAQVRKAQIQHRQRKANYVKQLEADVDRYRELIADAQKETQNLIKQNSTMKRTLQQQFTPALQDDITMGLVFDPILNAPSFRITSSPSPSQYPSSECSSSSPSPGFPSSPEQTQEAINFILALEHICRSHCDQTTGHTLTATSLALRSAPSPILNAASRSNPLLRKATPSDITPVSWTTSDLTLQTLHGLACSINTADLEITPVQAWFELAAQWPVEVLLRRDVLDGLKRELTGVVRCPHFGACMEREAFESVVGRVLGGLDGDGDEE
ncbi:hypothetical protein OQA88_3731 [Cercophora sp. LCS_1]